jgi:hypothetical protein
MGDLVIPIITLSSTKMGINNMQTHLLQRLMSLAGNSIQDSLTKRHNLMDMASFGTALVMYSSANRTVAEWLKGSSLSCSLIKLTLYLKSNMMNKEMWTPRYRSAQAIK